MPYMCSFVCTCSYPSGVTKTIILSELYQEVSYNGHVHILVVLLCGVTTHDYDSSSGLEENLVSLNMNHQQEVSDHNYGSTCTV